jgi:tetratricopeptide (TPR) repeat protein
VEYTLAKILMSGGRLPEVVEHLVKGLGYFRQCESVHGEFVINECFGEFYLKSGDLEKAEPHAQKAIELAVRMDSLRGQGHGYLILAKISLERADAAEARQHAEQAYGFFEQVGVPEKQMARSVSRAGAAREQADELGYVEALVDCASSPANIGDLMENYEFATKALRLAEDAGFEELAGTAHSILDDLTSRIEPLG